MTANHEQSNQFTTGKKMLKVKKKACALEERVTFRLGSDHARTGERG